MSRVPLCKCSHDEIRLFLVFTKDMNTHALELRSIDRTRERAESHLKTVQDEARLLQRRIRAWVDETISDHAFAASMFVFSPVFMKAGETK